MKKIAIIGFGGLGVPAFLRLLSSENEFSINIFEEDRIELSNLHRQVIFSDHHVGSFKLEVLAELVSRDPYKTQLINKDLILNNYYIDHSNIQTLLNFDLILDCTDNPTFKYFLSDFCKLNKLALIHAGAQGEAGFLMQISPDKPCLRCIFGDPDSESLDKMCQSCRISGILAAYSGLTGVFQAELALAFINDEDTNIKALKIDSNGSRKVSLEKSDDCIFCTSNRELNLKSITCPETFVYTKLALLKRTNKNERLIVNFANGDSLSKVEKSITEEGYKVYKKFTSDLLECHKLLIG